MAERFLSTEPIRHVHRDPVRGAGQRLASGLCFDLAADRLAHLEPALGDRLAPRRDEHRLIGDDHFVRTRIDAEFHELARELFAGRGRSEEHTSELQSLMRISYAVFCLKKKKKA